MVIWNMILYLSQTNTDCQPYRMGQTAPQSKIDMDMDGHMKYDFIFVTDQTDCQPYRMGQTAPQSKMDMGMDGHMKYDFIFVTDQHRLPTL